MADKTIWGRRVSDDADATAPTTPNASGWSEERMYAIAFDLDKAACERHYPGADWRSAYADIRRVLEEHEFWGQQGSVYYSKHSRSVRVWQAITELQRRHPWFRLVVRDVRMLRIEENDDLKPLLGQPTLPMDLPSHESPPKRKSGQPFTLN
jgi:virulence-associated protein VapD